MTRVFAACIGIFGLGNACAGLFRPEMDANIWWLDLRTLPDQVSRPCLICACGLLIAYAFFPAMKPLRRAATLAALGGLLAVCIFNGMTFFKLLHNGVIHSTLPVPLSLLVALVLLWIMTRVPAANSVPQALGYRAILAPLALCLIGFPLAQIFLFGRTDYSRPSDAALVFGARTYADGRASTALSDRVSTACALHRQGLVKTLIFSGGPGDGSVHETDSMRALALRLGVADGDIILDREGLNTRATLDNLRAIMARTGVRQILAVSHFYHLPRIKLECQRLGLDVRTVPAHESYTLTKMPLLVAREVAALWKYFLFKC